MPDGSWMFHRSAVGVHMQQLVLVYGSGLINSNAMELTISFVLYRLPAHQLGMIIDRGHDFPEDVYAALMKYGQQIWVFRDRDDGLTTRALNSYRGERRESVQLVFGCLSPLMSSRFQYLTPRVRITPGDLYETRLSRPRMLHFVCSPLRAAVIMTQVHEIGNWNPVTIYEPIPVCVSAFTDG